MSEEKARGNSCADSALEVNFYGCKISSGTTNRWIVTEKD